MRRIITAVAVVAAALAVVAPAVSAQDRPVRKIVVFEEGASSAQKAGALSRHAARKVGDLHLAHAAVAVLPDEAAARRLSRDPRVAVVEDDAVVRVAGKPTAPAATATQKLPWGVDRVDAEVVWPTTTGDPVKVAVIDTGIQGGHADLAANVKGGFSAVAYTADWADDNGHGTHVAGTIAAADNTIGVVGVAHAADLYGVKVLDSRGSGYVSDVIKGLDWAVANGMDVANMSLSANVYVYAFDLAVRRATEAGVVLVAAAGNTGPGKNTVGYPAKFASVVAVGATDAKNKVATFSSRGPEVDLVAPGVSIYSTYLRDGYATMSGTSMASPHVAGVAALLLTMSVGRWDADADGGWNPAEVENALRTTAIDLGTPGADTAYGSGLVQADAALGL